MKSVSGSLFMAITASAKVHGRDCRRGITPGGVPFSTWHTPMGNLLYSSFNPSSRRLTEVEREADGTLLFVHSQDTKAIVESAKQIASDFDPLVRRDTVHVARIPLVVWNRLRKLGITNDEKALNAWLNDPDNCVFRTDDRSTL
jgi:hypothetical protein